MRTKLTVKDIGTICRALWKREARVLEGGVYALAVLPAWVGLPTAGPLHHSALADLIVAAVVAANVFASSHAGFGAAKAVAIRAMALLMISAPCALILYVAAFNTMIAKADPNLASVASAIGLGVEILRGALVVLFASFVLFVSLTWRWLIGSYGGSNLAGTSADPADAGANNDPAGVGPSQQCKPGEPPPPGTPLRQAATGGTCTGAKLKKPRARESAPRRPAGSQSETKSTVNNQTTPNVHAADTTPYCSADVVKTAGSRTDELITELPRVSNGVPFGNAGIARAHHPEQTPPTESSPGMKTDVRPAWRTAVGLGDGQKRAKWVFPAIWASVLIALMTGTYNLWIMPKHGLPSAHCDAPGVPLLGVEGVTYQAPSGGRTMLSTPDVVNLMATSIALAFGSLPELPGVAPARISGAGDGLIRAPPAKAPKRQ
jgi:hypothetical protein